MSQDAFHFKILIMEPIEFKDKQMKWKLIQ